MIKNIKQNLLILLPLVILNIISLLNMLNAKLISNNYNNAFYKQLLWFIFGYFLIIILKKINIKKLIYYANYYYIASIFLLILVLFIGNEINGARCWINIFGLSFQPSEIVKITLTLKLIDIIHKSSNKNYKDELLLVTKLVFVTIIPCLLVFLEPDTGAIINYGLIFFVALYYAKLNKIWYISMFSCLIIGIATFIVMYFSMQDELIKIVGNSLFYRMDRIINFANGNSYQLENALTTIGNASLFGVGINKILLYIPEAPTDFIFAFAIGNYGIISAIIIIICYFLINLSIIKTNSIIHEIRYKTLITSFLTIFIFHQIYNIFMNIGFLPIMGIPLPILSYGGTNTILNYIYIGLILNIKKLNSKI